MSKQADKTNKPAPPKAAKPKAPHIQPTPVDSHLLQLAREDPASLTPTQRTHLQRTLGNRALSQLVGNPSSVIGKRSSVNGKQSPISNLQSPLPIQPKLTVNAIGDKYEQEADAVASEAVKKLQNTSSVPTTSIQRQELREEDKLHRKNTEVGTTTTTTSVSSNSNTNLEAAKTALYRGGAIPHVISSQIQGERGKGQPIPYDIRKKIDRLMGYDLVNVRIHQNQEADYLNTMLAARAFTVGRDIFFKHGEYNPYSISGQELLLHELVHVIQQMFGGLQQVQREEDTDWLSGITNLIGGGAERVGKAIGKAPNILKGIGKAASGFNLGMSLYDLTHAKSTEDKVQAGTDVGFGALGLTAPLIGAGLMATGVGAPVALGIAGATALLSDSYAITRGSDEIGGGLTGGQNPTDMLGEAWYEMLNEETPQVPQRGLTPRGLH